MNSFMFLEIIKGYIQAVNSGKVPVFEHVWHYASKESDRKTYEEALKQLDKEINVKKQEFLKNGLSK